MTQPLRRPTLYRERVLGLAEVLLARCRPFERVLDFGAGDGWFADQFVRRGLAAKVIAAEVLIRDASLVRPVLFDGESLPFCDRTFELTYAFDVLHHCASPRRALTELLRCTDEYFLLKDHTHASRTGWCALTLLDEIGNRRFGVPSPHAYQRRWEWNEWIEKAGFRLERVIHPAACHAGALGALTNRLQFVALWRRTHDGRKAQL